MDTLDSFFFDPKVLYTKSSVANDMQFESWCQEICLIKKGVEKSSTKKSIYICIMLIKIVL